MKTYFLIFFISIGLIIRLSAQVTPNEMVEKMGRGINLGNVFSAPKEGNWSAKATEQYFIDVAEAGFTNVRIPMDFFGDRTSGNTSIYSSDPNTVNNYNGNLADYIVDSNYLDRIEEVINWALNAGLVTTMDFHGSKLKDEFLYTFKSSKSQFTNPTSAKRAADNVKFRAIWTAIAERFKNHSENLLFEVVNEPYFDLSTDDMDTLNTDVIKIIRDSGYGNATRNIIITGGTLTSYEAPTTIDPIIISGDDYLIATFHYYRPFNFTSSTKNGKDVYSWGSSSDKSTIDSEFDIVLNWSETHNISILLGEFGADNTMGYDYSTGDLKELSTNSTGYADGGPDNNSRIAYHKYIADKAIDLGFAFSVWDAGPKSNKTINLRSDSGATNYDINSFSVTTYNPKLTSPSTVTDASKWVEDIKNALLKTCTTSTDNIILNSNFECDYNTNWSLSNYGIGASTFESGGTDSRAGMESGRINVITSDAYNSVVLSNEINTKDFTGKKITIRAYAKSLTEDNSFKMRIKAVIEGANSYQSSIAFGLSNNMYPSNPYEFDYTIQPNTTSIQFQILCGLNTGSYIFDDIEVIVEDAEALGIEDFNGKEGELVTLYPNPVKNILNIKMNTDVKRIEVFNLLAQKVLEQWNTNSINIEKIKKGVYIIKIYDFNNNVTTKKIIKD